MDYQITITVPANTPESNPREDVLEIAPGLINQVWIKWRRGAAFLCKVRIYHGEDLLYPSSPDEWYSSDIFPIQFRDWLWIVDRPWELTIKTYNDDDTFDHTVTIRVNVWPLELFAAAWALPTVVPNPWPELGGEV